MMDQLLAGSGAFYLCCAAVAIFIFLVFMAGRLSRRARAMLWLAVSFVLAVAWHV